MKEKLELVENSFREALENAAEMKGLDSLKVKFLGKKGELTSFMKQLKDLPNDQKAKVGQLINQLKGSFQEKIETRRSELKISEYEKQMEDEWIDITLDPLQTHSGSLHPVSLVQQRLEDIFESMGFQVLDGPHIETEYYNFEALNVPSHHPARDLQDTFYFEDGNLLRTQTSTIQVHGMEKLEPPIRIVGPGKVFRCERTDASHDSCFHQLEGMMIDRDISVAHLIYFMRTMLGEIFESDVKVRLRPGYFPFVEPGFELDMSCLLCKGKGCNVCKKVGWIELLGCGMVHPNVLNASKIDSAKYSGFAFGMGMDRLAMMKYGITDIRPLHGGNLNFMRRFATSD
ncbi:MAG: phenylalanine--tRNA ligase subunit alpha [Proteobacteria bacterium]|nr:phenylalanine--tRNA ligase subunit alpha [Pseudomonadota bacterium]